MKNLKIITSLDQLNSPDPVENNEADSDDCNPTKYMKPIFVCMAIVGVQAGIPRDQKEDPTTGRSFSKWGLAWCIFTAVIVWGNILRLSHSYNEVHGFNENTFIKVVLFVWYLQGGLNILICLRASIKKDLMHRLYHLWNQHCKQLNFDKNMQSVRKIVWLLTGYYIVFVIINIALISYVLYSNDPVLVPFKSVLYTPIGENEVLKVFLVLFQGYVSGIWLLPLWLFVLVSIVNKYMLEDTTATIKELTDNETQQYNGDLEDVRLDHELACDMVECADESFSLFVGCGLAIDMPMGCFVMYMMIWPNIKSSYLAFNACLLVMHIFHLCLIMWSASRVNTEAHSSFKELHKIRATEMNRHNQFQLLLFQSRLRGPAIGMSAYQFFTISRHSLLKIFSIILTYLLLLIELRNPG